VRPRHFAGETRRRITAEEAPELVAVGARMKKAPAEPKALVPARGSLLRDGTSPVVTARVLADGSATTADRNPLSRTRWASAEIRLRSHYPSHSPVYGLPWSLS
jgi:hypothetical protein